MTLPIIASLLLSTGAIVLSVTNDVSFDTETNEDRLVEIERRLDEQQNVILETWVIAQNNTAKHDNQYQFNEDVIEWATNVSDRIDGLADNQ